MISKKMHIMLKGIPHSPETTTFKELSDKKMMNINLLYDLLKDAKANEYIAYRERNPYNDLHTSNFCLTELGQIAIEEYEGTKYNSTLSTWALIIAGLSFIASVVAIVVSCLVQ